MSPQKITTVTDLHFSLFDLSDFRFFSLLSLFLSLSLSSSRLIFIFISSHLDLHLHLFSHVSLSLSLFLRSLFLLSSLSHSRHVSMTMTMITRPVGSLSARTAKTFPECHGVGLGPFVDWRIARSEQKQMVHVFLCCCCCFGRATSMSTKSSPSVQRKPSMTNNCWPSRAPKKIMTLRARTQLRRGVRKMPLKAAKRPFHPSYEVHVDIMSRFPCANSARTSSSGSDLTFT